MQDTSGGRRHPSNEKKINPPSGDDIYLLRLETHEVPYKQFLLKIISSSAKHAKQYFFYQNIFKLQIVINLQKWYVQRKRLHAGFNYSSTWKHIRMIESFVSVPLFTFRFFVLRQFHWCFYLRILSKFLQKFLQSILPVFSLGFLRESLYKSFIQGFLQEVITIILYGGFPEATPKRFHKENFAGVLKSIPVWFS